jgi:hypothetical protein
MPVKYNGLRHTVVSDDLDPWPPESFLNDSLVPFPLA